MAQSDVSFSKILRSDLKRVYAYQTTQFPHSRLKLLLMYFKFFFMSKSFRSVFFYRLLNLKCKNNPLLLSIFLIIRQLCFCLDIPYNAKIGEGLLFGHIDCIVIHGNSVIGKNATIMQGVTIGGNIGKIKNNRTSPVIGSGVFIGAGAKILGPVVIGDNCMIGANAVVVKDIPNDSLAVGVPAKVVKNVETPFMDIQENFRRGRIAKMEK
ncbi:MAG: serine acetyltransferase [Methanobacterium sp.]|nr:serine acetyltransferase [Methanobacterium sp.]